MAPTQSTVTTAPASTSSYTHHISIPAIVVLALLSILMAALAISVILRQRKTMASLNSNEKIPYSASPANWSSLFRFKRSIAADKDNDNPTAVGALHAASVLLAAAPCQVFSSPMTMHFRIPLEDKTILILGAPWFPVRCGAECCGALASGYPDKCRR